MKTTRLIQSLTASATLAVTAVAGATFHLMQIEQVIGGVNGNTDAQAIQLRMRTVFQNFVSPSRVVAWDAAGANPVVVKDMTTDLPNGSTGARVLIASSAFVTSPAVTPDFVMDNAIPASYLAAGSLTFEDDGGFVYWRLCWGGAAYTGSTLTSGFDNENDGNVAPAFGTALISSSLQALRFNGAATAGSTTNAADYSNTTRAAIFTNNAGQSGTVIAPAPACPGDIMDNNVVDVNDLLAVISTWGPCPGCPPAQCIADVSPQPNGNCTIDVNDLLVVITTWGPCQ